MAMWRPRLVVRRSRGGGVSSPTTTGGFLFFGWIGLLLCVGLVFAAMQRGEWWVLVALIVIVWPIKDAWAWLAASDEERVVFLSEVARLQGLGGLSPAGEARKGRCELPLLALLGIATCLGGALSNRGFYIPGLGLVALAVFGTWEQARRTRAP
jgi:hypothetical protein